MDIRISLLALHCSNQSLTGERDTSFPNELRPQLRWTSKSDSAGRLRWTSNRAKLPFPESRVGSGALVRHPYEALKKKICSEYVNFQLASSICSDVIAYQSISTIWPVRF